MFVYFYTWNACLGPLIGTKTGYPVVELISHFFNSYRVSFACQYIIIQELVSYSFLHCMCSMITIRVILNSVFTLIMYRELGYVLIHSTLWQTTRSELRCLLPSTCLIQFRMKFQNSRRQVSHERSTIILHIFFLDNINNGYSNTYSSINCFNVFFGSLSTSFKLHYLLSVIKINREQACDRTDSNNHS